MVNESLMAGTVPGGSDPPAAIPPAAAAETVNGDPQADLQILRQEIAELKKSLSEQQAQAPEINRMRHELAETAAQRDSAAGELNKLKRSQALSALASEHYFNDPEYLDFVLQKNNIEPNDMEKAAVFLQEFQKVHPRYFSFPIKPGAGSRPGTAETAAESTATGRFDAVEMMIAGAPEIY